MLPHLPGDLPVKGGDGIGEGRQLEGQDGHLEGAVLPGNVPAEFPEHVPGNGQVFHVIGEIVLDQPFVEPLVGRLHGAVGRKDGPGLHHFTGLVVVEPLLLHQPPDTLQQEKGAVTLVEVIDGGTDAQGPKEPHPPDPEHDFLLDTKAPVPAVKPGRDLLVLLAVFRNGRVEEIKPDPAHVHLPGLGVKLPPRQVDVNLKGLSRVFLHRPDGHPGKVVLRVQGHLVPLPVEGLEKITALVEKAHPDHGDVQVARRFQMIPRQDSQAPRVDGHGFVKAELGGKIGHGTGLLENLIGSFPAVPLPHEPVVSGHGFLVEIHEVRVPGQVADVLQADPLEKVHGVALGPGPHFRVHVLEEFPDPRVPRPPEVPGEVPQAVQFFRHLGNHGEAPEAGRGGVGPGEGEFPPVGARVIGIPAVRRHMVGQFVGFQVIGVEMFPVRLFGDFPGFFLLTVPLFLRPQENPGHVIRQVFHDVVVGFSLVLENEDPPVPVFEMVLHPEPEAGQVRRHRGDGPGGALEGGVPPGLVVRGENPEITARKDFFIGHVEQPVITVEIYGHENDGHGIFRCVYEALGVALVPDGVPLGVVELMGGDPRDPRALDVLAPHDLLGLRGNPVVAADDGHEGDELVRRALGLQGPVQRPQGFEKKIDALVEELVPSRNEEHPKTQGVQAPLQEGRGELEELLPAVVEDLPVDGQVRDGVDVDAVGKDDLGGPLEKMGGLLRRDLAHRGEAVALPGRNGLEGMLRLHVHPGGHVPGGKALHVAVDVDPVAAEGAPEDGGVGGEDRADLGNVLLHVEQSRSHHPLVKLGDGLPSLADHPVVENGHGLPESGAVQNRLDVVPAPPDGIDAEILPELKKELALGVFADVSHENHPGMPFDGPSAASAGEIPFLQLLRDRRPEILRRLLEFGVVAEIGSDEDVVVAETLSGARDLRPDHRVDAADLVADFPAHLEKVPDVVVFRHSRTSLSHDNTLTVAPPPIQGRGAGLRFNCFPREEPPGGWFRRRSRPGRCIPGADGDFPRQRSPTPSPARRRKGVSSGSGAAATGGPGPLPRHRKNGAALPRNAR